MQLLNCLLSHIQQQTKLLLGREVWMVEDVVYENWQGHKHLLVFCMLIFRATC
jgi:hypothetical protein